MPAIRSHCRRKRRAERSSRNFYNVCQSRDFRTRAIRTERTGFLGGAVRQKQCSVLESNTDPGFILRAFLRGNGDGTGRIVEHCAGRKQQLVVDGRCYLSPLLGGRGRRGYTRFVVLKRIRTRKTNAKASPAATGLITAFRSVTRRWLITPRNVHDCASPQFFHAVAENHLEYSRLRDVKLQEVLLTRQSDTRLLLLEARWSVSQRFTWFARRARLKSRSRFVWKHGGFKVCKRRVRRGDIEVSAEDSRRCCCCCNIELTLRALNSNTWRVDGTNNNDAVGITITR